MNQRQYVTHRRSVMGPTLIAVGIICLGLVGGALLLHSTGAINLPFLAGGEDDGPPKLDTRGKIPVPLAVRPVKAYERVVRGHILNPRTMQIAVVWMRPEDVPEGAAKGARDILGRVMRWDKEAGQIFMESEFYPKGTRPGPTAGIPPGKRAMRLRAAEVPGLHGLNQGDRFDIVMTVEVEIEEPKSAKGRTSELEVDGPYAPLADTELRAPVEAPRVKRRRAEVRVVVQDGIVVQPVRQRTEIGQKASLLRGSSLTAKPIEEMVIAVDPHEVAALNQARAIEANLQVAMRSGQVPEDGAEPDHGEIPNLEIDISEEIPANGETGPGKVKLIEVISGGKKRLMAVPVGKGEDEKKDEGEGEDG